MFRRHVVALLGMALCASLLVVAGPPKQASAQSGVDTTMLVFDLSGSMGAREAGGLTRLEVAQDAMITAINGIEPGAINLGIRTFSNCGVTRLAAAPGPVDKAALSATISTFRPFGATDISLALQEAANDLAGQSGRHSIILLSDGEDTCSGDPCATAQNLIASGIDVLINAIGIGTEGTRAEEQLACIAGATGGTVVSVDNAEDLFDALDDAITGTATGGLIKLATPTCINSPIVQNDDSLAMASVGSPFTDENGIHRTIITGDRCGFGCNDGFDANCDGTLGDFCPSELDIETVMGAGECIDQLDGDKTPVGPQDILAHYCDGDNEAPFDVSEACEYYEEGKVFQERARRATLNGDFFLANYNQRLADDAFAKARKAIKDALDGAGKTDLDYLNDLIARLPEDPANFDPRLPAAVNLSEAIFDAFEDELAEALLEHTNLGLKIEIALALVTGDWSDVPGGNPAEYDDAAIELTLRTLGYDELEPTDPGVQQLLQVLGSGVISQVFQEGVEFEFGTPVAGFGTFGTLLFPVGASATFDVTASTSVGNEIMSADFLRTNSYEAKASVVGAVGAKMGKSTVAKVYNAIQKVNDRLPFDAEALFRDHPLYRKATRLANLPQSPFSVSYRQFTGIEFAYEATLTADQADAVEADSSRMPDIFDPDTFEVGNKFLLRGGQLEGTSFEAHIKIKKIPVGVHYDTENFSGTGFGIEVFKENHIRLFIGDIEAVEQRIGVSIGKGVLQFGSETRTTDFDLTIAELNLLTSTGRDAYEAFLYGGEVPFEDSFGIKTGDSTVTDSESKFFVAADALGVRVQFELGGTSSYGIDKISYNDGSAVESLTAQNGFDGAIEITIPSRDGVNPDLDRIEVKIVHYELRGRALIAAARGYVNDPDHPGIDREFEGDGYAVQYTYSHAELLELQELALDYMRLEYESPVRTNNPTEEGFQQFLEDFAWRPVGDIATAVDDDELPAWQRIAYRLWNPHGFAAGPFNTLQEISGANPRNYDIRVPLPGDFDVYRPR